MCCFNMLQKYAKWAKRRKETKLKMEVNLLILLESISG